MERVQTVARVDFRGTGCYVWVEFHVSVDERDACGRVVRLIGTTVSVNEHKELEQSLTRAKEELEITNSMMSSVLSLSKVLRRSFPDILVRLSYLPPREPARTHRRKILLHGR